MELREKDQNYLNRVDPKIDELRWWLCRCFRREKTATVAKRTVEMAKQVSAICFMFVVVGLLSDPVHGDVQPEERINGYKFGGNGYVILDKDRFNPSKASLVKFSFRTFASEGLMFLMGTPRRDFLSLELNDGKVIYQYELGSGRATIASTLRFNDGNWHNVTANRTNKDGILEIDGSTGELLTQILKSFLY